MNCNSLDFVEELDYLVDDEYGGDDEHESDRLKTEAVVEDLPFIQYRVIRKDMEEKKPGEGDDELLFQLKTEELDNASDEVIKSIKVYCRAELASLL